MKENGFSPLVKKMTIPVTGFGEQRIKNTHQKLAKNQVEYWGQKKSLVSYVKG